MGNTFVDYVMMSINTFFLLAFFIPISLILEDFWNMKKTDYCAGKYQEQVYYQN